MAHLMQASKRIRAVCDMVQQTHRFEAGPVRLVPVLFHIVAHDFHFQQKAIFSSLKPVNGLSATIG